MKKLSFIILQLCFIGSCIGSTPVSFRIQSDLLTSSDSGIAFMRKFTYDSIGRLATASEYSLPIPSDPTMTDTTPEHYTYVSQTIMRSPGYGPHLDSQQDLVDHVEHYVMVDLGYDYREMKYRLNAQGQVDSERLGITYVYDSLGFMIARATPGQIDSQVIRNGDVSDYIITVSSDHGKSVARYTYYPDLDTRDFGFPLTGRRSRHLMKTCTSYDAAEVANIELHYTYIRDTYGRILQEIATYPRYSFTHTYTYFD